MKPEAVAVLDVGKTNVKLLAFNAAGAVVARRTRPSQARAGQLDVEAIWTFLIDRLRALANDYTLTHLVPTTHGCTGALVNDAGLVVPVTDYEAAIDPVIERAYLADRPDFAETLSPALPDGFNLGKQLYALARTQPQAFADARYVLTFPQYFAWRLTGVAASEVTSLGCHTDLWNPIDRKPSSLAGKLGLERLLPPVRPAWDVLGPPRPELGLPVGLKILSGVHDSNASYLRFRAATDGDFALVATGTWIICFDSAVSVRRLDPARDTLANVDVFGQPVTSSRFMGGREYAAIAGDAATVAAGENEIAALMARGLFALPSFAPGGPFPGRSPSIVGAPTTPSERAALATLYAALMTRESLGLIGAARTVYVDGPFARNAPFCRLLAALLPDAQLFATGGDEGAAVGASLLAHWPLDRQQALDRLPLEPVAPAALDLEPYRAAWLDLITQETTR